MKLHFWLINEIKYKFLRHLARKYEILKKQKIYNHFTLDIREIQEFLNYYTKNYNNIYSKRFKKLDLNLNRVSDRQLYDEIVRKIVQMGQFPHIVYELCDNDTSWIRVGRSSHSPEERMKWYLRRAFSPNLPADMANIYYEMAKSKSKEHALERFNLKVRYVLPNKGEAQIMEEFLTIYRNRAKSSEGYDLRRNHEYNKIVGDLFKRGMGRKFPSGALNPKWRNVPPDQLTEAILKGFTMNELENLFNVSPKTIRRRFKTYGYGIKGIYDLKDARAFLLKPIIIECFKKGLDQEKFFNYCENEGIEIFNRYKFIPNKHNPRGSFFRRIIKQIWNTSKQKEARYQVIGNYILSIIIRPDITPGEAEAELSKIVDLGYKGEFAHICNDVFGMDFVKKRDEIYKPYIEELSLLYRNENYIQLKIAIGLGLCSENDPVVVRDRASHWVASYVIRNYGIRPRELPTYLNPDLSSYLTIKKQVFKYMEANPIARPIELSQIFKGMNIETIRNYVKEWKKHNRNKVLKFSLILTSIYIREMDLNQEIETLALKLLEKYISIGKHALNMEWRGIIAGAIYLACRVLEKSISQTDMGEFIGVDYHTISKRYRDIADSLSIEI